VLFYILNAVESYVDKIIRGFRVDFIITDDVEIPQCIFFSKVPAGNGSMKPTILWASRLASLQPTHVHDNHMSLQTNCAQFRAVGTLTLSEFASEDTLGLEAFYRVAFGIAEEKKPHIIEEWLLKLYTMDIIEKKTKENP